MKGWRTIILNVAVAIFGVLEAADWTSVLGADKAGWAVLVVATANMAMRTITTGHIGEKA